MKSPIDPKECPYYLISRAMLVMTADFKKAFDAAGVGYVRPAYLSVLWCLWKQDRVITVELGRCAGLEPSTMTGLLDRMERDGLVQRKPAPDDRRAMMIHLTDMGRKIRSTVVKMVDENLSLMFMGVAEKDILTMSDVLRVVLSNARGEDF